MESKKMVIFIGAEFKGSQRLFLYIDVSWYLLTFVGVYWNSHKIICNALHFISGGEYWWFAFNIFSAFFCGVIQFLAIWLACPSIRWSFCVSVFFGNFFFYLLFYIPFFTLFFVLFVSLPPNLSLLFFHIYLSSYLSPCRSPSIILYLNNAAIFIAFLPLLREFMRIGFLLAYDWLHTLDMCLFTLERSRWAILFCSVFIVHIYRKLSNKIRTTLVKYRKEDQMGLTNAMKIDKITVVLTWLGPLLCAEMPILSISRNTVVIQMVFLWNIM